MKSAYQRSHLSLGLGLGLSVSLSSLLSLGTTALAQNEASSLYPVASREIANPLTTDTGRGIEKQSGQTIEAQQTCPQPYGDAWDTTSEQAWNMLEFGIQVKPEQQPEPKLQLYTRYTCARPMERPLTSR